MSSYWAALSGIVLKLSDEEFEDIVFDNCVEVDTAKVDDEYQAYVWSIEQKRYIPWGRGLWSERLCRARLVEAINKGWIKSDHFDLSKYKICKRTVYFVATEWVDL